MCAAVAVAGCDSSAANENGAPGSTPSTLTETGLQLTVSSGYAPCVNIPQSVLDSENLRPAVAVTRPMRKGRAAPSGGEPVGSARMGTQSAFR